MPERSTLARTRGAPGAVPADNTAAAAPSVNDEHINRVKGATTTGDSRTSSAVTGVLNCASGFRDPARRALAAAAAIWRGVVPRSSI